MMCSSSSFVEISLIRTLSSVVMCLFSNVLKNNKAGHMCFRVKVIARTKADPVSKSTGYSFRIIKPIQLQLNY